MFLKQVRIQNLRSIDHLELDFSAGPGEMRARTVLLGENGCGKSTALRAIALVVAGSEALAELLRDPRGWVRNGRKQATIAATLTTQKGQDRDLELVLRPEWNVLETLKHNEARLQPLDDALKHSLRNYFAIGYGVTRRPTLSASSFSQASEKRGTSPRARGMATMFSPEATLVSFEQWAMDLDYRQGVEGTTILKRAMAKLLPGMSFAGIDRSARELLFHTSDGKVSFQNLSDGYQNMANWCGDILYRISNTFDDHKNPLHARGLLLVDELDLHLHPVWQRRLMDFLASALPNLQIVATSHSPLIAQQLRENELYVVERPGPRKGAVIRAVAGDPSRLTLQQLMSPMFGIESSESVRVQELRRRARIEGSKLDAATRRELAELTREEELPRAFREQLQATKAVKAELAKAAGSKPIEISPGTLRKKAGRRIRLAKA